jgi:hypothetical protein
VKCFVVIAISTEWAPATVEGMNRAEVIELVRKSLEDLAGILKAC